MRRVLRASGGLRARTSARKPAGPRSPHSRRVVVKARIVQVGASWGKKAAKLHLGYLERDGVERDGSPGTLYGPDGPVERAGFNQDLAGEKHQFRIVLSPEDGHELDLQAYVRSYMEQVRQDLGQELHWAAVNHYNTDNPHAHIIIRGVDAKGAEVRLGRDYVSHGLRHRAEDLATEALGPRPERSRLDQLEQEAERERYTSLDRELERRAEGGRFRPARGKSRDPHLEAALRRRLEVLSGLGFVSRVGHVDWRLAPQLRAELQLMGRRAEGLRAIRAVVRTSRCQVIDRNEPNDGRRAELARGVQGVVRWKGLDDDGHFVAVVETTSGVAYHLPVANRVADVVRVGQVVELKRAFDKDTQIEEISREAGGIFDLKVVGEPSREAYRHRLEQLERMTLAARDPASPDRWKVHPDFRAELAKGKQQPFWQVLSLRSEEQSLEAQKQYPGPVWLDRVRLDEVGARGFGGEVREALRARHEYLRGQGLDPGDEKLRARLSRLQHQSLQRSLAASGGTPIRSTNGFEGTARVHREANGQRFVEVRSGSGQFALVPASRSADPLDGASVRLHVAERGRARLEVLEPRRDRGPER